MCPVIITCRSIFWSVLSIATTQILIASVMSPQWLVGFEREPGYLRVTDLDNFTITDEGQHKRFSPTIGIINRCTRLHKFQEVLRHKNCATFVNRVGMPDREWPDAWKASLAFFSMGGILLVFTMGTAVVSLCVQSMCGKSIFTVSGLIQSIAGLLCVIGIILYPVGWTSEKVKTYCGERTEAFTIDQCSLGWSFYLCVVAIILIFLCSVLSIGAERATSCRKVEDEILEGKALICVMA